MTDIKAIKIFDMAMLKTLLSILNTASIQEI